MTIPTESKTDENQKGLHWLDLPPLKDRHESKIANGPCQHCEEIAFSSLAVCHVRVAARNAPAIDARYTL